MVSKASLPRGSATAFHEAGHVVQDFREGIAIRQVTIVGEGDAAGHVAYAPCGSIAARSADLRPSAGLELHWPAPSPNGATIPDLSGATTVTVTGP